MAKTELLMIITFAALVYCTEVDDGDQKKRGAGKGTSLNTIPSGAQKQDYNTYSIYSQNPSSQTSSPSYQSQVPNSFYPSQASQYYNTPTDQSSPYGQTPQINLLQPQTSSQFVPINFIPNPGYQSKYQFLPSKPGGNIQLALLPQGNNFQSPLVQYPQNLFSQSPTNSINPQQHPLLNSFAQPGQYNVGQNLPLSLGNSYLGQPSAMVLLAQPNPSLYNNLLYQNPVQQSLYNYFPSNFQAKYGVPYASATTPDVQLQSQSIPKEENDITPHTSEYTAPSESNTSYKTAYASSRSSYTKL